MNATFASSILKVRLYLGWSLIMGVRSFDIALIEFTAIQKNLAQLDIAVIWLALFRTLTESPP